MRTGKFWPVHFVTTETQRTDLEKIAREEGISLGEVVRTLLDEAMKARGIGR